MTFKNSLKGALKNLRTNKTRSALTILGIVIGITSIMLVMSLGQGAQNLILGQIQSIGSKVISVMPGRHPKGLTDMAVMLTDSLKNKDIEALEKKSNVPHLAKIMPLVFGSETSAFGNDTYRATIFGVSDFFAKIYDLYPESGRIFNEDDIKSYSTVVVIGQKIKDELLGNIDPLGQKIKIKGQNYKIIGVLPKKGQSSFLNFDEAIILPYTTAQRYIFGIKYFHRVVVECDNEENVAQTVEDVKLTLRNSHNIDNPAKDDFFIETQAEAMEQVSTITDTLTLFLAAVAAISLLVGGVGIMNIMLVSVTERTREIGLRKSLGATRGDILKQFLFESVVLTATGGLIGITLGSLFSYLSSIALSKALQTNWSFSFPLSAAFLGIGVSAIIGLVFGIYPAKKAASKSPMEALRYE